LIFLSISLPGIFLEWYFLPAFAFALSLSLLAPFIDTPQGKKKGKLIYYSPQSSGICNVDKVAIQIEVQKLHGRCSVNGAGIWNES